MKALVVGGNGGIGTALVRLLAQRNADVTATWCHHLPRWQHPRVTWIRLDPTDEDAIATLAGTFDHLDWLVNTVGMLHDIGLDRGPERTIKRLDADAAISERATGPGDDIVDIMVYIYDITPPPPPPGLF